MRLKFIRILEALRLVESVDLACLLMPIDLTKGSHVVTDGVLKVYLLAPNRTQMTLNTHLLVRQGLS